MSDIQAFSVCGVEYIEFKVAGQRHTTLKSEFELIALLGNFGLTDRQRDEVLKVVHQVAIDWKDESEI